MEGLQRHPVHCKTLNNEKGHEEKSPSELAREATNVCTRRRRQVHRTVFMGGT